MASSSGKRIREGRGRGCWRILPKIEWTDFYRWCWFPDIPLEVEFVIGLPTNLSEGSHKQQPSKYCSVEVCVERHSLCITVQIILWYN